MLDRFDDRTLEITTVIVVVLIALVILCYLAIYINPQFIFNPFKPHTPTPVAVVTEVFGPTWTPTATPSPPAHPRPRRPGRRRGHPLPRPRPCRQQRPTRQLPPRPIPQLRPKSRRRPGLRLRQLPGPTSMSRPGGAATAGAPGSTAMCWGPMAWPSRGYRCAWATKMAGVVTSGPMSTAIMRPRLPGKCGPASGSSGCSRADRPGPCSSGGRPVRAATGPTACRRSRLPGAIASGTTSSAPSGSMALRGDTSVEPWHAQTCELGGGARPPGQRPGSSGRFFAPVGRSE